MEWLLVILIYTGDTSGFDTERLATKQECEKIGEFITGKGYRPYSSMHYDCIQVQKLEK